MYDYRYEDKNRVNVVIDTTSFYASVEMVERGIDICEGFLVVVSQRENDGSGLVMSASPMAKKTLGISNVMRKRDLPNDKRLIFAEPRMNLYVEKNMQINNIFRQYAADEDIYAYSIDESLIDLTNSYKLFGKSPLETVEKIKKQIYSELGLVMTVGMAPTVALAKMALDIEAKHNGSGIARWSFEDVPDKLWPITELGHVWSIGRNTVPALEELGIHSVGEIAHTDPDILTKRFGQQRGSHLFALSYGVDRTVIRHRRSAKSHGVGNSQILPKNYTKRREIKLIIKEIGEQTSKRIRIRHQQASVVHLHVGFSGVFDESHRHPGISHRVKMDAPTNDPNIINDYLYRIFDKYWNGQPIRYVGVSLGNISSEKYQQLSIFQDAKQQVDHLVIEKTVDEINQQHGRMSVFKASSLLEGSTAMYRAKLVGGHAGGMVQSHQEDQLEEIDLGYEEQDFYDEADNGF